MDRESPQITFPDADPATAGQFAQELRHQLLDASTNKLDTEIARIEREDTEALDAGSIVVLGVHVLTPFVAKLVAEVLFAWVKRKRTKLKVKNGVFELIFDHSADDKLIERIVSFLTDASTESFLTGSDQEGSK